MEFCVIMSIMASALSCAASASALLRLLRYEGRASRYDGPQADRDARNGSTRDADEQEELRRGKAMDDGFDNIMRFSVNGQDGFGGAS